MKLSFSRIQLYNTCPKQYEFACVKKIPRPISRGESFGSSVHNTLKKWGDIELSHIPKKDDQLTMFAVEPEPLVPLTKETLVTLWSQSFIIEGYSSKIEADEFKQKGKKLMEQFFDWWSNKKRTVVTIETSFKIPTKNSVVAGRFDRIEEDEDGLHIIDFKTSRIRDQEIVDTDMQLSIYAIAAEQEFQKPVSRLTLLFMRDGEITEVSTTRSKEQLDAALEHISTTAEGIIDEDFTATPSEIICTRCPYKNICNQAVLK